MFKLNADGVQIKCRTRPPQFDEIQRLALSAWMSCRRSRIPHALAVFDRRFARLRLTSSCGSVRLDSFPGHRYFVRLSGGFSLACGKLGLNTATA